MKGKNKSKLRMLVDKADKKADSVANVEDIEMNFDEVDGINDDFNEDESD